MPKADSAKADSAFLFEQMPKQHIVKICRRLRYFDLQGRNSLQRAVQITTKLKAYLQIGGSERYKLSLWLRRTMTLKIFRPRKKISVGGGLCKLLLHFAK